MVRDYDAQLLESVAVRRRRLRDALMFGALANRRSWGEGVGRAMAGAVAAAVLAGGCVGWAFVKHQIALAHERDKPAVTATVPAR
ncbi:hypothetical protein AB0J74_04070 [Asanoa sp. NPDC049573]|uniref:hypothetical protein n=1 Tax=Asanoa sp. NPDC049573 TaxID=3155396 RepID=UPI0034181302